MKQYLDKVREFQIDSGQTTNETPKLNTVEETVLRFELMKEENNEYLESALKSDIVGTLDAFVDMAYVLLGTINTFGLQDLFEEAFELVHQNNLSKIVDGKVVRNEFGKILKPDGFIPVDLKQLFS